MILSNVARGPTYYPSSNSIDHETANPLISVLMPTFNQAAFLRRALTSLFAQTHANWELLVVDDGSSDDTPRVLAEYSADPRIRSWRLEESGGFGRALNLAMSHARGPYIAYLPSDDIYYPHHLASLPACLVADQAAFLAYAGMRCHQISNHPTRAVTRPRRFDQPA